MTDDTQALLAERGTTHGDFAAHARITQNIKNVIFEDEAVAPDKFTAAQKEALEMVAHKIGRIAAGDPNFKDHWDDIAGYAKLVANHL